MSSNRHNFLSPPPDATTLRPKTKPDRDLLSEANDLAARALQDQSNHTVRKKLLLLEVTQSSAIEDSFARQAIRFHHAALLKFFKEPLSQQSLLSAHRTTMYAQPDAQPGVYRTINVTVGAHRPPDWPSVPDLMEEFFTFAQADPPDPVAHAAWAHIQFETIHPFADGNGRTGRALITKLLNAPIPLSDYILQHRQQYYDHLAAGLWAPYLRWFAAGVIETCRKYNHA